MARREPPRPPPRPPLTLLASLSQPGSISLSAPNSAVQLGDDSPVHMSAGHQRSSSQRLTPNANDLDNHSHAPPSPLSPGIPSQAFTARDSVDESPPRTRDSEQRMSVSLSANSSISAVLLESSANTDVADGSLIMHPNPLAPHSPGSEQAVAIPSTPSPTPSTSSHTMKLTRSPQQKTSHASHNKHHLYLDEERGIGDRSDDSGSTATSPRHRSNNSISLSDISIDSSTKEFRIDVSGPVKLQSIMHLQQSKIENRFANDFVPSLPAEMSHELLVSTAMEQFSAPLKQIVKDDVPYKQEKPKKVRLLDYEIDEPVKAVARYELQKAKNKTPTLTEMFVQPGSSPSSTVSDRSQSPKPVDNSPPLDSSNIFETNNSLGKYQSLGVPEDLVDPSMFHVQLDRATAVIREEQKKSNREGFFWRASPLYNFDPNITAETLVVKRSPVPFWTQLTSQAAQLLVSVQSLKLGGQAIEPLYCSLSIVDLKHEERCSEDFHFDLNDVPLLTGHLQVEATLADPLTLCKHALFGLNDRNRHEHTFFVVKIERILAGDQSADLDYYLKSKPRTAQELAVIGKKIRANLLSLSEYRQPFAWGMAPIFDNNGDIRFKSGSTVRIDKLFFQPESQKDEQFIAQAKEAAADGGKKHRQFVSSHFDFRVDELDLSNLPPNRVDQCCIPLKDSSNIHPLPMIAELNGIADFVAGSVSPSQSHNSSSISQRGVSICKEILDFSTASSAVPFTSFVNLLYVYPEFIKFDKYRNIACRVQIRANDAVVDTVGTGSSGVNPEVPRLIMGKSSTSSFCASAMTQVNYHKRSVNPQDEVKLMLPMNLTSTHHLFFTFYKVSCKNKPGSRELIGYSVLPIYQRHRLVSNDVYHLPIASKLPKGYMAPFIEGVSNSDIQFLHGGAKSVSVRIRGISSVFNSDEQVSNFLQTFPNVKEVAAIGAERARDLCTKAVECLPRCNELLTVQFLPSLLDLMFDILVTRSVSPNSQLYAFHALTHIVQRVSDFHNEPHRCTLLAAYVQHRLDHRHLEHPPVYVAISRTWLAALQHREASLQPSTSPLRLPSPSASQASLDRSFVMYSWFFFESMTKSLGLSKCSSPTRTPDPVHEKEFLANMALLVPMFVRLAQSHRSVGLTMVKSLVNNLAAFFLDCFYVLRKEQVIEWTGVFCRGLHNVARDPVLVEMKFSFHSIILDHPAYPDLTELQEMDCEPFENRVKAVGGTRGGDGKEQGEMQDDAPHPSHTNQSAPAAARREREEDDPTEPDSRSRIVADFLDCIRLAFPLAHLMLDDYITHIGDKEAVIKEQVIDTLRNFLTKVDYDRRWRSAKPMIATMLFPLIPALLEQFDLLSRIESKVRRQVLAPVLFILHQVPERVLDLWWSCESVDAQANFLDLLRFVIVDFHYVGIKAREDDPDANCIMAPESVEAMNVSQGSIARATSIGDYKTDIESYMASIHKVRTQAGSRAKMHAITSAHHNHAHAVGTVTQMPSLDRASTHRPSISHTLHANTMSSAQFASALNAGLQSSASTSNLNSGTPSTATVGPVTSLRQLRAGLSSSRSMSGGTQRGSKSSSNTVSGTNLEFALTTVRYEGALTRQAARVVVLTLARFLCVYHVDEIADSDAAFLSCSALLSQIVNSNQANSFLIAFFPLVLLFVEQLGFAAHRTSERTASLGQLANAVFRAASFTSRAVRRHAVTIIYALLQNEYKIQRDLTGMQIQLTIALSKLTDTLTVVNERCLQQAFAALVKMGETIPIEQPTNHSTSKTPIDVTDFTVKLNTLLSRLSTILGDSMEISRQTALGADADSATSENLLCQVADAFSHLPDIRIEWLLRLARHHKKRAANAEAAQCYLLVASLASRLPRNPTSTRTVQDRTIMEYLESACDQLDRGELYEQCNDVYHVLLPYYHRTHDYARLSKAHLHIHSIFDRLIAANKAQTRMLGTFYRIGFYGRKFGPRLNGTELVYKTPKITRLSEISSSMRALYSKQLGCPVRVLPDSGPVDRNKLDPEECVLQVTFVSPYFGPNCPLIERMAPSEIAASHSSPTSAISAGKNVLILPAIETLCPASGLLHYEEPRPRDTFIERHSFIQHFQFSTPFSATGKSHASIAEQQKRNTIITVKHPFPSILTAQLVIAKSERVLTPIQSATDDVQHRTEKLAEIVDSPTPNAKAITNILQGSVAAQVNGGAREICHAFLQPLSDEDKVDIGNTDEEKLREALRDFLRVCVRGLQINNQLSTTDAEKEFQTNLDNSYEEMLQSMKKCLYRDTKRKGSTLQQLPTVSFAN